MSRIIKGDSQVAFFCQVFAFIILAVFLLISGVEAEELREPGPGLVEVSFSYQPPIAVEEVYLSGEFNDWDPEGTLMTDDTGDGIYDVTIFLEPGEYEYKFVIEGEDWITPEDADDYAPDGFGGENAVIQVGEEQILPEEEPVRGDGQITADLLHHDIDDMSYFNPRSQNRAAFHFETYRGEVESVKLRLKPEGDKQDYLTEDLYRFLSHRTSDFYRGVIELPEEKFSYYFQVIDGETEYYYGDKGAAQSREEAGEFYLDLAEKDIFHTPDWVQDAVFYQIFPDRFARGSTENDPGLIELYQNERERYEAYIPEWHQGIKPGQDPVLRGEEQLSDEDNAIHPPAGYYAYYGGDLLGVKDKIPYLQELGINAVYFNPIFAASAYHRYNTSGFEYIDTNLVYQGDQEASQEFFARLVEELNEHGIKVILDGVFNHVGYEHWAFQDVIENEEDSEYLNWFDIHSFPIKSLYEQQQQDLEPNYDGWWDFGHMPELNVDEPEVREYIWRITEKWMDKGIDGWRLDVPTDVTRTDPDFWSDWREHVKSLDEDAYITGEIWGDGSSYLQGDEFDAVMNYRFRNAVNSFVGQGRFTAEEFHREMMRILFDYPDQAVFSLLNLLGSHDTARYMTVVDGDRDKFKLSKLLQMTYIGAPMIYYGDEIGMEGADDPDNRRTMVWEDRGYTAPDEDLREYISELIQIRNENEVLRRGEIKKVNSEKARVYSFLRTDLDEDMLVIINAEENPVNLSIPETDLLHVDLTRDSYEDIYRNKQVPVEDNTLNIELPGLSGSIISL